MIKVITDAFAYLGVTITPCIAIIALVIIFISLRTLRYFWYYYGNFIFKGCGNNTKLFTFFFNISYFFLKSIIIFLIGIMAELISIDIWIISAGLGKVLCMPFMPIPSFDLMAIYNSSDPEKGLEKGGKGTILRKEGNPFDTPPSSPVGAGGTPTPVTPAIPIPVPSMVELVAISVAEYDERYLPYQISHVPFIDYNRFNLQSAILADALMTNPYLGGDIEQKLKVLEPFGIYSDRPYAEQESILRDLIMTNSHNIRGEDTESNFDNMNDIISNTHWQNRPDGKPDYNDWIISRGGDPFYRGRNADKPILPPTVLNTPLRENISSYNRFEMNHPFRAPSPTNNYSQRLFYRARSRSLGYSQGNINTSLGTSVPKDFKPSPFSKQ